MNGLSPATLAPSTLPENGQAWGNGFGPQGEALSIMIPNYNGARYLGETITSVLAQGEQVRQAQICVLDNASTDESEAITQAVGGGRVGFVRHAENIGALNNYNLCLSMAERTWVHVLHSDDTVLPGSYGEADRVLRACPNCDALFARALYMDEESRWTGATPMLAKGHYGELPYDADTWRVCPIQFVGAFLRRDAVEATGGFRVELANSADWNLWWRVAKYQKPAYTNACIGAYRVSMGNGTSRGLRTGEILGDGLRHLREYAATLPGQNAQAFGPMFEFYLAEMSQLLDDADAFRTNLRILNQFPQTAKQKAKVARLRARFLSRRLRKT